LSLINFSKHKEEELPMATWSPKADFDMQEFVAIEGAASVAAARAQIGTWADNAGAGYHTTRFSGLFRFAIDVAADSGDIVSVDHRR
jgi:hypothetical protein